jgi:hypothetical protein
MGSFEMNDARILHLARQFAEIHIGDGDILGKMARELLTLIDWCHPEIKESPCDEETP